MELAGPKNKRLGKSRVHNFLLSGLKKALILPERRRHGSSQERKGKDRWL